MKDNKSVRLFSNPILEVLSKAHPLFPLLLWGPIATIEFIWGVYTGVPLGYAFIFFIVGMFSWTFFEYILHRFLFHYAPKNERLKKIFYYFHEVHHDYHYDRYRLVAPPLMSVTLATAFYFLFRITLGSPDMWPFFAGFLVGYLCYDYVHYFIHFSQPKFNVSKILRRHHLQHHFAWSNRWYGVSSPLWDYIFGTAVSKNERPSAFQYRKQPDGK